MSSMVTSGAVIGAAPEMVPLVERSMRFVVSLKLYIHIGSDALPYGWNVSIVVPSVQSFAPPVLPTPPVEPSYVLPMRTERAMPSNAMFKLFMTDWSACAFLFAFTSERSAPTQTTMTTENSPMATIISTRVKPEFAVRRRPRRFDCRPAADGRRFTSERARSDEKNLASLCLISSILIAIPPVAPISGHWRRRPRSLHRHAAKGEQCGRSPRTFPRHTRTPRRPRLSTHPPPAA